MLIGEEVYQEFVDIGRLDSFLLVRLIDYLQVFLHDLLVMGGLVPYKLGNAVFIQQKIVLFLVRMLSLLYKLCIAGVSKVTRLDFIKVVD